MTNSQRLIARHGKPRKGQFVAITPRAGWEFNIEVMEVSEQFGELTLSGRVTTPTGWYPGAGMVKRGELVSVPVEGIESYFIIPKR